MKRPLTGKTALVTGSIAGLGRAFADSFAAAGANVVMNGLAAPGEGEIAALEVAKDNNVKSLFVDADLCQREAVDGLIDRAEEAFGNVDILINNAVIRHFAPIEEFASEDWDQELAVNLSAAFRLVQRCLPSMKAQRWGRIFNLTSIYSLRGEPHRIGYITCKSALAGMTRGIAIETAQDGITCNSLGPGVLPTPAILDKISKTAEESGCDFDTLVEEYAASRHPTGRMVPTNSVAAMAVFLCSQAGDDITGANFPIDGGWQASL